MNWRVIRYCENDAFMNMAIDEVVSDSIRNDQLPTIRFYGWSPPAVSIGYFQEIESEVDLKKCLESGVDVVRRRTGGGAVYHDTSGEITYSIIAKEDMFPKDILASYREICGWIIDSLSYLGISAEFKPINDIIVKGKKISGNAQTRRGGVLLQHGTILHSVDPERMFSLLKVPDEKIRDKMIRSVKERVTSVSSQGDISKDQLNSALIKGFTNEKDYFFDSLSEEERSYAERLAHSRYRSREWNHLR